MNVFTLDLPTDSLVDTNEELPMEGRYVGDVWLSGAARALQRDIIVFTDKETESGEPWVIEYFCQPAGGLSDKNPLRIGYVNSNHYIAFVKKVNSYSYIYYNTFMSYLCISG